MRSLIALALLILPGCLIFADEPPFKGQGPDNDGDLYGSQQDCDDSDATINPAADEVCDGDDNDCDDKVDEGCLT